MSPTDPRHGTTAGWHAGCKCEPCRTARARYEKLTRWHRHNGIPRAIPARGAQRRIQALMALGYTSEDIRLAAGWHHRNAVLRILTGQKGRPCVWVERNTHQTICDVFEQLCMKVPDLTWYRKRARTLALNKGYAPPLAWDDIDNDEAPRLDQTCPSPRKTGVDLDEFDRLVEFGESEEQAARRLGVTTSAIERARQRARKVA